MSARHLVLALLAGTLLACSPRSGLEISSVTLSPAPPDARMRAGYLTIVNHDARDRTLVSASSPAYEVIEFHRTVIDEGVARMRREENLPLAAGGRLDLEPGGRHLMLMRPTGVEAVEFELCFADGECLGATVAGDR